MAGPSEVGEEIEHAAHENKGIALLIAVLALFLAFASAGGKGAQTEATTENIHASDLWAFFQAKAARATTIQTAAEAMQTEIIAETNPATKSAKEEQIKTWKQTIARYESDPASHDGKKELAERAKEAEEQRELSMAKYHHYEIAAAALEIGIVLSSATIITGMAFLAWVAGGLGIIGLGFIGIAMFAPLAVHLF